jgi:hypothetical protein
VAKFTIQAPDGRKLTIEAGDQATAIRGAQEWVTANPKAAMGQDANLSAMSQQLQGGPGPKQQGGNVLEGATTWLENAVGNLPIVGTPLQAAGDFMSTQAQGLLTGQNPAQLQQDLEDRRARRERDYPMTAASASILAEASPYLIPAVGTAAGIGAKLGPSMVKGALAGQGLYTADALVEGKGGLEATGYGLPAVGGAAGALVGAGVNKAGEGIAKAFTDSAQRKATSAAIQGAPDASGLAGQAKAMFQAVDNSGVTIDPNKFGQFVQRLASQAKRDRINPTLDPKATAAYQELIRALGDVQQNGGSLMISDLHTLRQIAQKAATSSEGRDAMFAQRIVDGLDEFVAQPGTAILPPNRLGTGSMAGGNELLEAISTWGRSRRVSLIEEAVEKARMQQSGLENGLRLQFRSLLRDPKKRRLFTAAEIQAIEDVANGTALSNMLTALGKFGIGDNRIAGPSLGVLFGGLPGLLAATGSRKLSERMGSSAAQRAAQVVATPNIPTVAPAQNPLIDAARLADMLTRAGAGAALQPR